MKSPYLKNLFTFLTFGLCSAINAANEQSIGNPFTLDQEMAQLTLHGTPHPPTPLSPEELKRLDNDLYDACKGADPLEGQQRTVDIERVKELLTQGANINMKGPNDNSPLHVACSYGFANLVIELLTWNPEINAVNAFHMTALYFASGKGFDDIVSLLLTKNPDTEIGDLNKLTPIHIAVIGNHFNTAKLLLNAGANVNAPNSTSTLPIHSALSTDPINFDLILLLIQHHANLSAKDCNGLTPLNIIFSSTNIDLHLCLINADVNADVRRAFEPFFLYGMFCKNKDIRILKALLAKGMDINIRLKNNWTPLHFACSFGDMDSAEYLIRQGADVTLADDNEKSPLELLTKRKDMEKLLSVVTELMSLQS